MNTEFENIINGLQNDKDFLEKVCTATDPELVKVLFLEKDVELDDAAARAFVEKVQSTESEELNEDDLENVSGGILGLCATGTIAACAICGVMGGVVLGAFLVAGYYYYKQYKKSSSNRR